MINKKEKIESALFLLSFLDTIGFYNGIWEFNYNNSSKNIYEALNINLTIINHYMALGGFNNISIDGWHASDDTILTIATTKELLDGGKEIDFINNYINVYDELLNKSRASGNQTLNSIKFLKKIIQKPKTSYLFKIPFGDSMGGNGAAIRTGMIGIFYADDINKLISTSISASRLTHNIPIGYLGGFVSALFASYAFKNIEAWLWIDLLLDLVSNNKILDYIHSTNIKDTHDEKIIEYFSVWYLYRETRFNDLLKYRGKSSIIFVKERLEALSKFVPERYFKTLDKENWDKIGLSGLDSVIFAYDSLLMSIVPNKNLQIDFDNPVYNPESLLFFSSLHVGDSDSTGAIAGFWYGALKGLGGFDIEKIKKLEFYKELKNLSIKLDKIIK